MSMHGGWAPRRTGSTFCKYLSASDLVLTFAFSISDIVSVYARNLHQQRCGQTHSGEILPGAGDMSMAMRERNGLFSVSFSASAITAFPPLESARPNLHVHAVTHEIHA